MKHLERFNAWFDAEATRRWILTIYCAVATGSVLAVDKSTGGTFTWLDKLLTLAVLLAYVVTGYMWGRHHMVENIRKRVTDPTIDQ